MKVAYIQTEPEFGQIRDNVQRACELLKGLSADLVVLPELFNTGYYLTDSAELPELSEEIPGGYSTDKLCEAASKGKMHIVAGVMEKSQDRYYNSAVLVGPQGYIGKYRKIHLFNEEKLFFEPGDEPFRVYDIGSCRLGIMICYDWIYPESTRVLALEGAQLIAHCANLVMPYCPDIMPSRCFDNRVFAITADRAGADVKGQKKLEFVGLSQIVNPRGEILNRGPARGESVGIVEIDPALADDKGLNPHNNLFADRRPEMYGPLTR